MLELVEAVNYSRPTAIKMLRTMPNEVDDILQVALAKAFKQLRTFERRNGACLKTWVTVIVIRECLQLLRRKRFHTTSLDDAFPIADHTPSPERRTIARDSVNRILPLLTSEQRVTFKLLAQGWTMEEIGAVSGRTVGSTKAAIWRARRDVREMLQEQEGFEAVTSKGERGAK